MTETTWLESLKAGDQVAEPYGNRSYQVRTIASRTKMRLILDTGREYNARTGRSLTAGKWDYSSLAEVTPEMLANIERENLINAVALELTRIDNINLLRLQSNELLAELLAVLKKHEAE